MLAAVEIDLAMMCASIPVFWPVLRDGLLASGISVTREFNITLELRRPASSTAAAAADDDDDDDELRRKPRNSRTSSQEGLAVGGRRAGTGKERHYHDDFVKGQVDPLRSWPSNATIVEAARPKDDRRRKASLS